MVKRHSCSSFLAWAVYCLFIEWKALIFFGGGVTSLIHGLLRVEIALHSKIFLNKKGTKPLKKLWSICEDGPFFRIEVAALEYYKNQGYFGVHDEGFFVNQTMRAAMLHDLISKKDFMKFFGDFSEPRHLFAQGLLLSASDAGGRAPYLVLTKGELVEKIRAAPKEMIRRFIHTESKLRRFHASPRWNAEDLLKYDDFLDVVSCELLANIAERQIATGSYAGFPDLTLWRGANLKFVEVKSPNDRITPNQKGAFGNVLLTLDIDLTIAAVSDLSR